MKKIQFCSPIIDLFQVNKMTFFRMLYRQVYIPSGEKRRYMMNL